MREADDTPLENHLIEHAPPAERERLLACCETVELAFGAVLGEQHRTLAHAHFPLTGLVSLVARVDGHPPMELGVIGRDGMVGASLLLGVPQSPHQAVVQTAGSALRIESPRLQTVLADSPGLLRALHRYQFDLLVQLSQTTVCTRFHLVEARLARWLLMSHDRMCGDRFRLTHQFLADLLGVQRSAVTIAAGGLRDRRLIGLMRGGIRILDRRGLEAAACGCYAAQHDRGRPSRPTRHQSVPADPSLPAGCRGSITDSPPTARGPT